MSRRNQFKSAFTLAVAALSLLSVGNQVQATVFSDDFNGYSGNQNNAQFQSNLEISHSGTSPGWSSTGGGAIHAVDLANLNGQNNPSNYAPMIWQDNVLTQAAGIAANVSGFTYSVNFDASAAVYAAGGQATQAHDAIKVDVLRSDNSVLASYMHAPGAWTGNMAFSADNFQYVGDGSGSVRLRIGPNSVNDGHFQGAIDNLVVNLEGALFAEDFNGYSGNQNTVQFQSGLEVSHSGSSPGWSSTGGGDIHAVDLANLGGQNNPSNYAPMIWQDNVLTQAGGIDANDSGTAYSVSFDASAAVYAAGGQATQAHDAIKVDVLRSDNSVLASYMHAPGAWTGNMLFGSDSFQYIGDGSGDVRLRIGPNTAGDGHFQGSIDNIVVNFADAGINVPEPATATLALLGLGGLMMRRRRAS